MAAHAPNTEALRDPATQQAKPIQPVLMADMWEGGSAAISNAKLAMQQFGILPALPCGDSHEVGDHCHGWPPHPAEEALSVALQLQPQGGGRLGWGSLNAGGAGSPGGAGSAGPRTAGPSQHCPRLARTPAPCPIRNPAVRPWGGSRQGLPATHRGTVVHPARIAQPARLMF